MILELKYGKWYHLLNHYRPADAPAGLYLDSSGAAIGCSSNYLDVSASIKKNRTGLGTSLWRMIPVDKKKKAFTAVLSDDSFYLQNCYGAGGYLDVCGNCQVCKENRFDVSLSRRRERTGQGGLTSVWQMYRKEGGPDSTKLHEGDAVHIRSMYPGGGFLDTCGAAKGSDNRNDVSTAAEANRSANSGLWSFIPHDIR